jgi:hypothetical protein
VGWNYKGQMIDKRKSERKRRMVLENIKKKEGTFFGLYVSKKIIKSKRMTEKQDKSR